MTGLDSQQVISDIPFHISSLGEFLLCDGSLNTVLRSPHMLAPYTAREVAQFPACRGWNEDLKEYHWLVEFMNAYIKRYNAAEVRNRHSVAFQELIVQATIVLSCWPMSCI